MPRKLFSEIKWIVITQLNFYTQQGHSKTKCSLEISCISSFFPKLSEYFAAPIL